MSQERRQADRDETIFSHDEISISKEVLPSLEDFGFEETQLGEKRGSIKQYRNVSGLHAREYSDRFVIHRDRADPRSDPIGHILRDSPETLVAALATSSLLPLAGRKHRYEREDQAQEDHASPEKRKPSDGTEDDRSPFLPSMSPLGFLLIFLSLRTILGRIKEAILSSLS
jgi:hypothetical protein